MTAILDSISEWVQDVVDLLGYPGIAMVMVIENLFPPIPSELVLPFAGFLASEGRLSFVGVIVSATLGVLVGATIIYGIGMAIGERRARLLFQRYGRYLLVSAEDFDRASRVFNRYGKIMVLVAHLFPGLRSFISLPAGINRMNIGAFLVFTAIGAGIWNTVLAFAGLLLAQNWDRVLAFVDRYEIVVWAALGAIVLAFVVRRVRALRRQGQRR